MGAHPAERVRVVALDVARDRSSPDIIVGRVHVKEPPTQVWSRLKQVDDWARLFTDIRKLEIRKREGDHWLVDLDSVAFGCGPRQYDIRLKADRSAQLRIEAPGVDATGTLSVASEGSGSRFEYRLRLRFIGAGSCFAAERDLRDRQWRFVGAYVADVERAFSEHPAASR
jgi:hypothetical protein